MKGLAVLDVGKSNVKLAVLDGHGALKLERRRPNKIVDTPPYPHYDIEGIWNWFLNELAEAAKQFPVDALVATTHGACAALVNDAGLVLPVLDYESTLPESISAEYDALRDPFDETFSPALPAGLNLGRQLYWQAKNFPKEFRRARFVLTYPQYWAWRLSGVAAAEVTSLGCHTDLWQPQPAEYSILVTRAGWEPLFPPLRPAWASLGALKKDIAARTGLPETAQVLCGIHDSNASLLPHLLARQNTAAFNVVSTGTWVIVAGVGARLGILDGARDMLANVDALARPVPCVRFMGGREFELLNRGMRGECLADDVHTVVKNGAMALPSFAEAGGPFLHQVGRVIGEPIGAGQRYALATLYCALLTDYCLDLLESSGDIVLEGSFTANPHFAPLLAALRPTQSVLVSEDAAGTLSGAAALGRWGEPMPARTHAIKPFADPALAAYRASWRQRLSA